MIDEVSVSDHPRVGSEFSNNEFDEAFPPGYERHYWHRARSAIVKSYVQAFCDRRETLLEIGAARGYYVSGLRKAGFDVYGCDLGDPWVHEEARPFVFLKTDFASIDKDLRDRVTTVLLLDVLEHIEQPVTFIEAIFRAFPALRSLIITVPARQELWSNFDDHYRHFLRYDVAELRKLALPSRLSIKSYSYFFHALYVPALLQKKLGMNRATAFGPPKASWLHGLLGIAFWVESQLLPNYVYGTSLICACAKDPPI
ncbi:bifunctional 2-polyprenyl-6-hydroxyphenol methylase/3-demethylubiquinol 3-O-methyltransferase UbiG [Bradyrhizobium sp. Ec3.3]|uniref:class I SAM-dependent methyltransferase n=1 Tax=Bradyrhizobium sp. Ec3.3 TaxID=189753 RepID=UPI0004834891|nr:methyltransferase domain-containing protein [Bradyrhizobium sp. Ec3.3]